MYKSLVRPFLFLFDPEDIHRFVFDGLSFYKYIPFARKVVRSTTHSAIELKGLKFKSRIGLAAGMDKGAEVYDELSDFGFGFIEIGTITPNVQVGNPRPRIFRLVEDQSLISRTGFNNPGLPVILKRLANSNDRNYILGANINRDSTSSGEQLVADFLLLFTKLYADVDYFTLNWGSINPDDFEAVLLALTGYRKTQEEQRKIFIKLPADIPMEVLDLVIQLARQYHTDGFIATGPTMDRRGLKHLTPDEGDKIGAGGVSGKGLGDKSLKIVQHLANLVKGEFIIIGAGGVMTPKDAVAMIAAGADLIQIYSAFIYGGPGIVKSMDRALTKKH